MITSNVIWGSPWIIAACTMFVVAMSLSRTKPMLAWWLLTAGNAILFCLHFVTACVTGRVHWGLYLAGASMLLLARLYRLARWSQHVCDVECKLQKGIDALWVAPIEDIPRLVGSQTPPIREVVLARLAGCTRAEAHTEWDRTHGVKSLNRKGV